jgi:hypothetical protein
MLRRTFVATALALMAAGAMTLRAQIVSNPLGPLATLDVTTMIPASDPALTDPAVSQSATTDPPFMPRGGLYKLFGAAKNGVDPQNPFNEVISFDTTDPAAIAGAVRILGDHIQVTMLTNQIELKYFFLNRTCGGGSPRIQLGISGDGDGNFNQFPGGPDQNAFGYLGDKSFGGACVMNVWVHEDMTDSAQKWDLSQWVATGRVPACDMTCTWTQVVSYFQTFWPNHRVLNAVLVDDSGSFIAADRGCVAFDLVNTGARTYTNHEDASSSGTAPNSCP